MFFSIFGGYLSQSRPKSTILRRFAIFLGSRNPPTPAGVRRFKLKKPALRSAAFGGLPSLPPGVHPGNQNGSIRSSFSASNFGIIFGMVFFPHFTPFGAPLAPLWLLLGILDAFWPPFWLSFGSLLLQICIPFSNLVFASILHRYFITFYMPRTTF